MPAEFTIIHDNPFKQENLKIIAPQSLPKTFGALNVYTTKPENFTGIALTLHVYNHEQKYLFTTYCFISRQRRKRVNFYKLQLHNKDDLLATVIKNVLYQIYDSDKQFFGYVYSNAQPFGLQRILVTKVIIDMYFYSNDTFVGAYRYGQVATDVIDDTQFKERLSTVESQNGMVPTSDYFIKFDPNLRFESMFLGFDGNDIKLVDNKYVFKFDANNVARLYVEYDKMQNGLRLCHETETVKNIDAYASVIQPVELFPAVAPVGIVEFTLSVNLLDDKLTIVSVPISDRYDPTLSYHIHKYMLDILSMLCDKSQLIIAGGTTKYAYSSTYVSAYIIVPLRYDDILTIDNGIAKQQYSRFLNMYKTHGMQLFQRLLLAENLLVMSITSTKKLKNSENGYLYSVIGFVAAHEFRTISLGTTDFDAPAYRVFKGKLIQLSEENLDLNRIDVTQPMIFVLYDSPLVKISIGNAQFALLVPWHVFYVQNGKIYIVDLPDEFKTDRLYTFVHISELLTFKRNTVNETKPSVQRNRVIVRNLTTLPLRFVILADNDLPAQFKQINVFTELIENAPIEDYSNDGGYIIDLRISTHSMRGAYFRADVRDDDKRRNWLLDKFKDNLKINKHQFRVSSFIIKRLMVDRSVILLKLKDI